MFWLPLHAYFGRSAVEIQPNQGQFSKLYVIHNSSKTAEATNSISAIVCVPTGDVTSLKFSQIVNVIDVHSEGQTFGSSLALL